jgi:hypothetical protein
MQLEMAIFCAEPDTLRRSANSVWQGIAVCVIRQALLDALWLEKETVSPWSARDQRSRAHDRIEAIEFFTGNIDPDADQDVGLGDDDLLLTLDRWCDIGGLDLRAIRDGAISVIGSRSPLHARIVESIVSGYSISNAKSIFALGNVQIAKNPHITGSGNAFCAAEAAC